MTRVKVSKDAAEFVRSEAAYLRHRNPHAAKGFADTVRRAKDVLKTFADAGNVTHGLQIDGGLTLVVDAYLFDYMREDGDVNIIAVRHGRMRQLTPNVEEELEEDSDVDESYDDSSSTFKL
ncbi:type II toxin-antitoxin system RelE/ParE family toxin [Rhizobium sp. BK376]|uniref:type II toxin-antitoxin system RelE/ParE family toxin n=1 Tax=Rhizobium sp. BK376 TaxID=2512149 RepID=UPI0010479596|nr:type II toxin-antitoxin system RelE/ParE family toxin [Rhizobium sp. BK376]TCR70720.1 plasmid stabilization system protein ParE [Rhizobium sp. BK376]